MSINNPDIIDEWKKKLDEDIKSGELQKYLHKVFEKERQRIEYIDNKAYFKWLTNFIHKLKKEKGISYATEDFLYIDKSKFSEQDINNEAYIGENIFDLFDKIGKQQGKEVIDNDSFSFPDREYYFKFDNKMYFICELIGQGTEYILRTASNKEKNYLDLDLYFENK